MTNIITHQKRKNERGNVLFLILIAVALFAALSFVIANSSRLGGGDVDNDKAKLASASIMNQVTSVRTAVSRLVIAGCDSDQLNFANINDAVHVNPSAPADGGCDIFGPRGGGVIARTADRADVVSDPNFYFSGSSAISGNGTTCTSPECGDLTINLIGVAQAVCLQLNKANGIELPIGSLPTDTQSICPYRGTFDCNGNGITEVVFTAPAFVGSNSFCYNDSVKGLTFTHVILQQ